MINAKKNPVFIGRRTRSNIVKDKVIRKDEDGYDVFEDYWTNSGNDSILSSEYDWTEASEDLIAFHSSNLLSESSERLKDFSKRQNKCVLKEPKFKNAKSPFGKLSSLCCHPFKDSAFYEGIETNTTDSLKPMYVTLDNNKEIINQIDTEEMLYFRSNRESNLLKHKFYDKQPYPDSQEEQSSDFEFSLEKRFKSVRQKYPPLAHWRNQRLLYRCEKGQIKTLGIDDGTAEDKTAVTSIIKSMCRQNEHDDIKMCELNDGDKNVCVQLSMPYSSTPWSSSCSSKMPYRTKVVFQTKIACFGFIEIYGFKTKRYQYLQNDDLHMTVVRGRVKVIIQNNEIKAFYRNMFFIPRGTPYKLRNLKKYKAILSFARGKFKFLESILE